MTEPGIRKIGAYLHISREAAIDLGMIPPTPDERAQREQERAERKARHDAAQIVWRAAIPALDAITDPLGKAILDLHRRAPFGSHFECEGCDFGGYEGEASEWPCRTVYVVAAHHGIELPDECIRVNRPADGSLDAQPRGPLDTA